MEARYHGELAPTNNQAEAQGMLLGLELGLAQHWEQAFSGLLVMGDSNLVVAFMQHLSRPGQQALVAVVMEARRALRVHGVSGCDLNTYPENKTAWPTGYAAWP